MASYRPRFWPSGYRCLFEMKSLPESREVFSFFRIEKAVRSLAGGICVLRMSMASYRPRFWPSGYQCLFEMKSLPESREVFSFFRIEKAVRSLAGGICVSRMSTASYRPRFWPSLYWCLFEMKSLPESREVFSFVWNEQAVFLAGVIFALQTSMASCRPRFWPSGYRCLFEMKSLPESREAAQLSIPTSLIQGFSRHHHRCRQLAGNQPAETPFQALLHARQPA